MLKLEKNNKFLMSFKNKSKNKKNIKSIIVRYQNFFIFSKKKKFLTKRIKKKCKKKTNVFNTYYLILFDILLKKYYFQKLTIRMTSNNIFCTLIKNSKTILNTSAGKFKVKMSRKQLKFASKIVLKSFFKKLKKVSKLDRTYICLIAPKFLRRKTLRLIFRIFKKRAIILEIINKKKFNGCRSKKQKRKKRKGRRIFG